nr:RNA polymerase sigma-54 factor [Sphingomonas sp.]
LPRLLLNRRYHAELKAGAKDKASKAWLGECVASANWLVKALDQRARTIVKVVGEIVKRQSGFFEHGVAAMKPLTLREVAEAIGMHESTVSRVTSNKYLLCDRGLYELKYFFGSGVASAEGEGGAAAQAVKAAIRSIIDAEAEVLSDDAIAGLLKQRGFDCARRTVVKYREAIGIGSSVQRRRRRKIAGAA